jgi:hypothetical protein
MNCWDVRWENSQGGVGKASIQHPGIGCGILPRSLSERTPWLSVPAPALPESIRTPDTIASIPAPKRETPIEKVAECQSECGSGHFAAIDDPSRSLLRDHDGNLKGTVRLHHGKSA